MLNPTEYPYHGVQMNKETRPYYFTSELCLDQSRILAHKILEVVILKRANRREIISLSLTEVPKKMF